jgi:hypothetical protein
MTQLPSFTAFYHPAITQIGQIADVPFDLPIPRLNWPLTSRRFLVFVSILGMSHNDNRKIIYPSIGYTLCLAGPMSTPVSASFQ